MRKWHLPDIPANDERQVVHQVAHDSAMAGHLDVRI